MRRIAVLLCIAVGVIAGMTVTDAVAETPAPRHPLSGGTPIKEIAPLRAQTEKPEPVQRASPTEPVERRSRQPTQPPRIQPNERPEPPAPIETRDPVQRPEKPNVPIGTIDPRPGTIRTNPGTIEAK